MKLFKVIVLLLVLLPALALAQKKPKKPAVPAVIGSARYVYVEAVDGDAFKPGLYTGDRVAIADVIDAIRAWGRYTFVTDRDKAELVFVVRRGRLVSGDAHGGVDVGPSPQNGRIPGQQQHPIGAEVGAGTEVGPPDDLLEVCTLSPNGKLSGALWMHSRADGLEAPQLVLFLQFKNDVERAYPSEAAGQPSKP